MISLRHGLTVGQGAPVRINCNIGCNSETGYIEELKKIEAIKSSGFTPDMMMDLARILRTDVLKNRENYNTIHITDMTITAEHLNIDLSRLKSILNDLPEELLCAPSPEQNKDQGDIPF